MSAGMNTVNPTPIGMFRLSVHRVMGTKDHFVVNLDTSGDLINVTDAWIQAAACLLNNAAKYSGCGFEKTLELVNRQVHIYRTIELPLQNQPPETPENTEFPTEFPSEMG